MPLVGQFEFILLLLLVILVLSLVASRLHAPPAAAFILGGAALALTPGVPVLALDPNLVLVLFLPPLLMSSAYFTVWRDFRENLSGILLLAVGAVIFTTLVVGVVVHSVAPGVPWAVCFALGAVVSPPDAVAAEAVLERLRLPGRVVALLQGESLLNDAAGLVLFRFAVTAALTGAFNLGTAAVTFATVAVVGVLVGVAVGVLGAALVRRLHDPQLAITATLLLPWASYIGGEWLHASGVLATVVCGMILGRRQHSDMSAATRVRADAFWRVMIFLLEAMVFILIGLSLRGVLSRLGGGAAALLIPVGAVLLAVIVSRFVWVFCAVTVRRQLQENPPTYAGATVLSWAGMRGVVSLAIALALPESLPGRDLVLVAAFAVILVTVLVQGTTLGVLIRALGLDATPERDPRLLSEEVAWARMAKAQFDAVAAASQQPDGSERHPRLLEQYGHRARSALLYAEDRERYRPHEVEHFSVILSAVRAGRAEVLRLHRAGQIHDQVLTVLERELDLQEVTAELMLE